MRTIHSIAAALLCLLFQSPLATAQEKEYLFILKGRGNVFWKVIRQGVEETAKELGVKAVVLHTDDD